MNPGVSGPWAVPGFLLSMLLIHSIRDLYGCDPYDAFLRWDCIISIVFGWGFALFMERCE